MTPHVLATYFSAHMTHARTFQPEPTYFFFFFFFFDNTHTPATFYLIVFVQIDQDPSVLVGVVFHHVAIVRNKRCLLAYLNARLEVVKVGRWSSLLLFFLVVTRVGGG